LFVPVPAGTAAEQSVVARKASLPSSAGTAPGELLCLALATCYCNDVYREASRRGLAIRGVEVGVAAEFGGRGEPARRLADAEANPGEGRAWAEVKARLLNSA
jgi:organic hydroperoxide reductase OsmC/OhrA